MSSKSTFCVTLPKHDRWSGTAGSTVELEFTMTTDDYLFDELNTPISRLGPDAIRQRCLSGLNHHPILMRRNIIFVRLPVLDPTICRLYETESW